MIVKNYTDEELRQMIICLAEQNGINEMYQSSPSEMAESFLAYTPLGRQIILDWYSGLEKTKNKMNWIAKNGFEHKYFYIAGVDAAVAMMLLGYRVNSNRCANITRSSMERLNQYGHNCYEQRFSFFEKYDLCSKNLNQSWNEIIRNDKNRTGAIT